MHVGAQEDLAHYPSGLQEWQEGFTKSLEVKDTRVADVVNVLKRALVCRTWRVGQLLQTDLVIDPIGQKGILSKCPGKDSIKI